MSSKKSKQRKGGKPSVSEQQKIQDRIDKRKFIRKGLEFSTTENCKLCRSSGTLAVACDSCSTFYHLTCVNITEDELVDSGTWICPVCVNKRQREEKTPEKDSKKRPRPSRTSDILDDDFVTDESDQTYSLDRKISLPIEIATKYKRFLELTDIHHAVIFKDYMLKSDEEKEVILSKCQEEVEVLFEAAYESESSKTASRSVSEELNVLFNQFLSWQRLTRLAEILPDDKRFKRDTRPPISDPIPEPEADGALESNNLNKNIISEEDQTNFIPDAFNNRNPSMRPPSAHPPPTQPPPISGQPPVVYFTPRQQANQFKLESSPNTRALKVIQTNPNQVLPNPIYNRRPQQQGVNNNNNNTNNITIYQQPNISNFQPNNPYSPRPGVGGEQNTSLPPHPLFNQPIESQDLEKSNSISSTNTATEAPVAIKVENEVKVEPNSEDPAKTQDENI